ncbi:MAG TPA: toprim domain-containing protein [Acidiphilium sp.]
MTPDDPAGRYLARRYLGFAVCNPALRYRRDVPHPSGSRWPAMLCRIDNAAGEMVAVQRVFLTLDGHKAKLDPVKAAKGPVWTAAIRFGTGPEIVIAEGPETAIAAGIVLGLPAWSAISAGNLARGLTLPVDVQGVVIAADNDAPGIDAAERAARRWQTEGRQVRVVKPDEPGSDFANLLARRAGAPA